MTNQPSQQPKEIIPLDPAFVDLLECFDDGKQKNAVVFVNERKWTNPEIFLEIF